MRWRKPRKARRQSSQSKHALCSAKVGRLTSRHPGFAPSQETWLPRRAASAPEKTEQALPGRVLSGVLQKFQRSWERALANYLCT